MLRAKGLPHKKFADVKIKQRTNQYESRTTLSNNSKGLERCKTYVQRQRILHGTFGEKQSEVRFTKDAGALIKKQYVFKRIVHSTENVSTAPKDVLSEKCATAYYFDLLYN